MEQVQYIKQLKKKQVISANIWLRLARKSADVSGFIRGGKSLAQGVGISLNNDQVVKVYKSTHKSEVRAAAKSNKINKQLHKLELIQFRR